MQLRNQINKMAEENKFEIPDIVEDNMKNTAEEEMPVVEIPEENAEQKPEQDPIVDSPEDLEIAVEDTNITVGMLKAYKELYSKISETRFENFDGKPDDVFVYHTLDRQQFNRAFETGNGIEDTDERAKVREIAVIKAALLYPDPESDYMTEFFRTEEFLRSTVSNEILAETGFKTPKTKRL